MVRLAQYLITVGLSCLLSAFAGLVMLPFVSARAVVLVTIPVAAIAAAIISERVRGDHE